MAAATIVEQQGLQKAIAAAIEKEERAAGRLVGNQTTITTYIAVMQIGGRFEQFKSQNLAAFIDMVKTMQARFPLKPISLFEQVDTKQISKMASVNVR